MELYQLIYEDLTHLGGPMGSEYTTKSNFGFFTSVRKAQSKAENYHSQHSAEKIAWRKDGDFWRSQDLGYAMFYVIEVRVEG
jgi:cytochrome oxidase Cu insertion factor (SCO1/SenC/PrrC family)